jgi:hypothetical protein
MQIKNIKIFDSTVAADGPWVDVSDTVNLSVQIANIEPKTWIEVSNDPYVPISGFGASAGNLVAAPTSPPVLSQAPAAFGGLTGQGTYFVKLTYIAPWGETTPSPESSLLVADGNVLRIAAPNPDPTGVAGGWNVYVGKTSGSEVLQTTPQYTPARTSDAIPGFHDDIEGGLSLSTSTFSLVNGYQNTGIVVPSVNNGGGVGIGANTQGTGADLSVATQTLAAISIFVDAATIPHIVWTSSGMTWKWLRVRKDASTHSKETIAWLCGVNG